MKNDRLLEVAGRLQNLSYTEMTHFSGELARRLQGEPSVPDVAKALLEVAGALLEKEKPTSSLYDGE